MPLFRNGSVFGDYDANVPPLRDPLEVQRPASDLLDPLMAVPPSPDSDRYALAISCFVGASVAAWANAPDFRRELNEIQLPLARKLFVLAKASHLAHLEGAGYMALIEAADTLGHPGVGVLLETCLADKFAFAERTKRLIREHIEQRVSAA